MNFRKTKCKHEWNIMGEQKIVGYSYGGARKMQASYKCDKCGKTENRYYLAGYVGELFGGI